MRISSRTLFHFTKEFETLVKILEGGFWPRYCIEYGWYNKYIDFAVPMVCFCDIPLSLISEHVGFYGKFGIGVSSEWVKKQKDLTPVKYVANESREFSDNKKLLTKLKNGTISDLERQILLLSKKVRGKIKDKQDKYKTKKFYDEREWRYVPSSLALQARVVPVPKKETFDRDSQSKLTENKKIKIDKEDIRYLIIPDETYRIRLINKLQEIYPTAKKEEISLLISKIISVKQINDDF